MAMNLNLFKRSKSADISPLSMEAWSEMFSYLGNNYAVVNQTMTPNRETIEGNFPGLARGAFKGSGVVFACMNARLALFTEARFQFRQLNNGRPGDLFGTTDLELLERPWPNGTSGDLLARAELDVSLAGNFYLARRGDSLRRLRPDWVDIIVGSNSDAEVEAYDIDAEVIGYVYYPGGRGRSEEPVLLLPEEVAHYAPIPDPEAHFRGMSWLTPIVREILADKATTQHKVDFFQNAATPNMKVKLDISDPEKFNKWADIMDERHKGVGNHFKTLYLAAGHDAEVIGSNLRDIDFTRVQGGGEVRIAAAAGVPADIVGLAKSLEGSALNNAAKDSSRRRFADITMRPLWRNFCGSIQHLINVPSGAELWYDTRDIAFLKDDVKDAAEALQVQMSAISTGVTAGFDPDSVVQAVVAGDLALLQHSGLVSVQLLPPGTDLGGNDAGDPAGSSAVVDAIHAVATSMRDLKQSDPALVPVLATLTALLERPTTDPALVAVLDELRAAVSERPVIETDPELLAAIHALAGRAIEVHAHLPEVARPRTAKVRRKNGELTVTYEEDQMVQNGNGHA